MRYKRLRKNKLRHMHIVVYPICQPAVGFHCKLKLLLAQIKWLETFALTGSWTPVALESAVQQLMQKITWFRPLSYRDMACAVMYARQKYYDIWIIIIIALSFGRRHSMINGGTIKALWIRQIFDVIGASQRHIIGLMLLGWFWRLHAMKTN